MSATSPPPSMSDQQLSNVLEDIEDCLKAQAELDIERQLRRLEQLLEYLVHNRFTPEQAMHMKAAAMPKLVLMLLKIRTGAAMGDRLNGFLQYVLHLSVTFLRDTSSWEMVETVTRILTDGANHHFYHQAVSHSSHSPSCEVDSQSSGEASGSEISDEDANGLEGSILKPGPAQDEASPFYVQNIERFHDLGGFDIIIQRILREPRLTLTAVKVMLRPFIKVKHLMRRSALQAFSRRVYEALMDYVTSLTDEQLKLEDRKTMNDIHKQLDSIVHSARFPDAAKVLDKFHLALALKCLKTPYLEKRLCGLNDVKEAINISLRKQEYMESLQRQDKGKKNTGLAVEPSAQLTHGSWSTPDFLVDWLQQERVVELIFGEGLHDQVVKRCVELLCFLAMRNALDSRLLELIWRASLDKHESVRQAIYVVLVDLTAHLPLPLLDELYQQIGSVPAADYTSHTLGLLRGFSIAAISSPHNPQKGKRWYGLDEFWSLMQDSASVGAEVRATAAGILGDLLTWHSCSPQRGVYLQRCVQQLREGSSVPQSLRLCCKVIGSFPCKARKRMESTSSILEWLAMEHQLLPAFFYDFERAHHAAKQRAALAEEALAASRREGNSLRIRSAEASLSIARTERMHELQERLDFLNFCIINAPLSLDQKQLDVLWECCVVSPCCPQEADQVFHWLEQARMNSTHALCEEATNHLFTRASSLPLESLSPTAYSFLEYFFRWINWKDRRFIQQEANAFTVLDLPLLGTDTLWQVALRASDVQVGQHVVPLLTQLHHSLSPELAAQQAQQRRHFVSKCMEYLGDAAGRLRMLQKTCPPGSATDDVTREWQTHRLQIERCLTLLRLFVQEVEKKAGRTDQSQPHGMAVRGVPMRVQVTVVGGSNTPKLEVATDTSQTIGSLRSCIWMELGQHGEWQPEAPRMLRMISAGKELKDELVTLGELKLREPYSIHVMRRQHIHSISQQGPQPASAPSESEAPVLSHETTPDGKVSKAPVSVANGDAGEHGSNPGFLLSEEGTNFGTLFDLLSLGDEQLSSKVWELLMLLPTNRKMQAELTALQVPNIASPTEEEWGAILHSGPSSFKLLYSLQIVDMLMIGSEGPHVSTQQDSCCKGAMGSSAISARRGNSWRGAFVTHGGLHHLLRLLANGDLLHEQRGTQRKPCLVLLLRILCQFLLEGWTVAEPLSTPSIEVFEATLPTDPPKPTTSWERRTFTALRDDEPLGMRVEARSCELGQQLMSLLTHIAMQARIDGVEHGAALAGQPMVEGSEATLDVQIGREALQLLVGIVRSTHAVLELFCNEETLPEWLFSMLLRCPNVQLRLEVCAALHHLASAAESSGQALRPTQTARTVRGMLTAAMLQLLPRVEAHSNQCRQFFDLLQALLTRTSSGDALEQSTLDLCQQLSRLIREHGVCERRDRPELVDGVLLGYITLLHSLVHASPNLKLPVGAASHGSLISNLFSSLFLLPSVGEARLRGIDAPPKCKSPENRGAALALLAELADGCEVNLRELIELLLQIQLQRSSSGPLLSQWHFMPSSQEKSRTGYVGLKNLGATCYLNSLMQQLYMIPEFRTAILELPIPDPPPATPPATVTGKAAHATLLYQLQLMFGYLQESEKKSYDTRELCATYRDCDGRPIHPSIQMDVDEFFNVLFYQLESALKDSPQPRILQSLFGGYIVNQIVSKEKGKLSERVEPFYTISIEVKSKRSVLDGLAQYVEGEVLDGDNKYKCESGEYVEAVKRTCIHTLPPVLILHLKRFEFDFDLMKKMKLNDHCEFPSVINMERFAVDYLERQAAPDTSSEAAEAEARTNGFVYQLAGVLVHSGTSDSGHYYSFIRERRVDEMGGGRGWLHFNDTLVEPFDERDIPKCCYGGFEPLSQWDAELAKHVQRSTPRQHSAYMLFYERMQGSSGKEPPPGGEGLSGGTVCQAEPDVAAEAELTTAESGAKRMKGDGEEPRGGAQLAESSHPVVVPESVLRAVWAENMQFLRDRYTFDSLHFAVIRRAVGLSFGCSAPTGITPHIPLPLSDLCESRALQFRALQLGCRFVVETLAHAKDKSSLPDWLALLHGGLSESLPGCRWLLLQAESSGWLRKMLLVCTVAEVRTGFAQLLLHAIRSLRPHELSLYASEPALSLAEPMQGVALASATSSSNNSCANEAGMDVEEVQPSVEFGPGLCPAPAAVKVSRQVEPNIESCGVGEASATAEGSRAAGVCVIEALLRLLHEASSHWRHFPQFFLVLLEFGNTGLEERAWLLSRRALSQLVDFYLGDESPLIASASADVQHRPKRTRMGDKFTLPNLEHMVALISLLARSSSRQEAPERTPMSLQPVLLTMAAEEHELATHPTFVSALLKDGLNVSALSELLQHYCFESTTCTSSALQVVLQGIDTMDSEALGPYLHIFSVIVQLTDSIQGWRTDVAMARLMRVIANNMRYKHATVASIRMLTSLHAAPFVRRWLFEQKATWLLDWLLYGPSDQVRQMAEQLCFALITAEMAGVPAEQLADDHRSEVPASLVAMHDQLIAMLTMATSIAREMGGPEQNSKGSSFSDEPPIPRLAPFFRVCTYCARQGATPTVPLDELAQTYAVVDALHWECDEGKREILRYWYVAAQMPQPASNGALALATSNLRRLLDSFISLRPNERSLKYNRELLPVFYGLMRCVLSSSGLSSLLVLQSHRNFEWAVKYLLVESQDYTQLMTPGEPERALGPTLLWLLKQCANSTLFRHKILTAALCANKLPAHENNIVVLLSLYIMTDDDMALACDLDILPQLTSSIEAMASVNGFEARSLEHVDQALRILSRICEWLKSLPIDSERRVSTLAEWDLSSKSAPLLKMLFALLHSLRPVASDEPGSQITERLRASCLDLACQLAELDLRCSHLILTSLLNQHTQPSDVEIMDSEGCTASTESPRLLTPHTLAKLPLSPSRLLAKVHSSQLVPYYVFASQLLYGSLNAHSHDKSVVEQAVRLALLLAIETAVLVEVHAKFARLLLQVCDVPQDSNVYAALVSELSVHGSAFFYRVLFEEACVLLHDCVHSCCKSLLSIAPPKIQWVRSTLDQIAQRLTQMQPLLLPNVQSSDDGASSGTGPTQADEEMSNIATSMYLSCKLLRESPIPAETVCQTGTGEKALTHDQYWLEIHVSLLPLLDELQRLHDARTVDDTTNLEAT